MSTPCELILFADDKHKADSTAQAVLVEAKRLEKKYSYYKEDSILSQINSRTTKELDSETKNILQRAIEVNIENRAPLLRKMLKSQKWERVLVFMANKRATDNIASKFRKHGFNAESFHGELSQDDRNFTLDEFKAKKIQILFATDIASRGLDIDNIDCVVNYDLPRSPTDYIHRIGRTARAGKSGIAISFISHENKDHFKIIQKKCKTDIVLEQIEGYELTGEAPIKVKGKAPVKGKKKSKKDKLREQALKNGN